VGEYYHAKDEQEARVAEAMPDIRAMVRGGNIKDALANMAALGMSRSYAQWVIRTTQHPASRLSKHGMQEFQQYASPEQRTKMQRALQAANEGY
jgi:hypothetical protein